MEACRQEVVLLLWKEKVIFSVNTHEPPEEKKSCLYLKYVPPPPSKSIKVPNRAWYFRVTEFENLLLFYPLVSEWLTFKQIISPLKNKTKTSSDFFSIMKIKYCCKCLGWYILGSYPLTHFVCSFIIPLILRKILLTRLL